MKTSASRRDPVASPTGWNRQAPWLGAAAIALATLAVYANTLSHPLVFDDVASILENPSIRDLGRITAVLSPPATDGMTVGGRPVLNLSLALNYAVSGTEVWSYHALNVVIHLLAGLTLFGIVRRTLARFVPAGIGQDQPAATAVALAVAALWTLHPLQTESVTYVIQRAESLMGLFYLQTLYAFIRSTEEPTAWKWPAWCIGACLLGMATKEVMVSAPFIVLLYDRTFVAGTFREAWRQRRRLYVGLAGTWILLGLLVASTGGNRGGSIGLGIPIGWWEHALTQFRAVARYLWLSFWPHPLVFDYGPERITGAMDVIPYALPVGLLAWITWRGFRKRTALGFAGVWFFAVLAPTSLLPAQTQMTVEHRMYLPLALVLAAAVIAACRIGRRRILLASLGVGAVFAGLTVARNRDYRSELTLWEVTARQRPDNPVALGSYGAALFKANRLPEALAVCEQAVQLNPGYWDLWNNLGLVLEKMDRLPEAVTAYVKSLQIGPDRLQVRQNLARTLLSAGRPDEAAAQFQEALKLQPESATAHAGLGTALMMLGRAPEAVEQLAAALRARPDDADAKYNLANALVLSGRPADAVAHYEALLRSNPGPADAVRVHTQLGRTFALLGDMARATGQFREALRIDPNYRPAWEALRGQ
jgi:tetratricopeptide (TPR) repeat protein